MIGNKPLTIVEDLHANNSAKTVLSVDGVFGLKTNPHTDHYERARDAVECIDKRDACNEADFFRHLGLEPANQRLLLIKSRGHFRAAFEPIASRIIKVDAPGAATPNLEHYHYKKLNVWPINREKVCTT